MDPTGKKGLKYFFLNWKGEPIVLCKGADSVILQLLGKENSLEVVKKTKKHITVEK